MQAVLYDVHGNLDALDAVLADARASGASRFVLGGDYALFGALPRETVERLQEFDATWIRGNTDRWLADAADGPGTPDFERSLEFCRARLGEEMVSMLAGLAETAPMDEVLFCHASPRSDLETFPPEPGDDDQRLIDDGDPAVIVFGHSHLQFMRPSGDRLLVNPGSVGMPFDGDRRAAYALWDGGRDFELRRAEYDVEAYTQRLRDSMSETLGDSVETLVRRLEQARFA